MTVRRFAFFLSCLLSTLTLAPAARASDDTFQAWYQTTVWWRINQDWSLGNYADLRVNDAYDDVYVWLLSPRLRYDVNPYLQLQLNTSWVERHNGEHTRPVDSFRLEFEANPTIPLSKNLIFSMRNRFEWRWMETDRTYNNRIRVRPQLDWLIWDKGFFRGFFANHETIWDFDQHRVTETRFVPLGLIFKPTKSTEFRLSYLWRQTIGRSGWYDYHAAVAAATINF